MFLTRACIVGRCFAVNTEAPIARPFSRPRLPSPPRIRRTPPCWPPPLSHPRHPAPPSCSPRAAARRADLAGDSPHPPRSTRRFPATIRSCGCATWTHILAARAQLTTWTGRTPPWRRLCPPPRPPPATCLDATRQGWLQTGVSSWRLEWRQTPIPPTCHKCLSSRMMSCGDSSRGRQSPGQPRP
jgi:hypothetical protein